MEKENFISENFYGYIQTKAARFIKVGAEIYRSSDAFKMPRLEWELGEPDILELLKSGCEQLLENKGLSIDDPIDGLTVSAFYKLLAMFHFKPKARNSKRIGQGVFVDEITFEHEVTGDKTTIFNLVRY